LTLSPLKQQCTGNTVNQSFIAHI